MPQDETNPAYRSNTPKGMPSTPKDLYEGAKETYQRLKHTLGNMLSSKTEAQLLRDAESMKEVESQRQKYLAYKRQEQELAQLSDDELEVRRAAKAGSLRQRLFVESYNPWALENLNSPESLEKLRRNLNKKQGRGPGVPLMDGDGRLRAPEKPLKQLIDDEFEILHNWRNLEVRDRIYRLNDTPETRQKLRDAVARKGIRQSGDIDLSDSSDRRNNRPKNTLNNLLNSK